MLNLDSMLVSFDLFVTLSARHKVKVSLGENSSSSLGFFPRRVFSRDKVPEGWGFTELVLWPDFTLVINHRVKSSEAKLLG